MSINASYWHACIRKNMHIMYNCWPSSLERRSSGHNCFSSADRPVSCSLAQLQDRTLNNLVIHLYMFFFQMHACQYNALTYTAVQFSITTGWSFMGPNLSESDLACETITEANNIHTNILNFQELSVHTTRPNFIISGNFQCIHVLHVLWSWTSYWVLFNTHYRHILQHRVRSCMRLQDTAVRSFQLLPLLDATPELLPLTGVMHMQLVENFKPKQAIQSITWNGRQKKNIAVPNIWA